MARSVVSNPTGFVNGLQASVKRFEKKWIKRNRHLMSESMRRLIARTPVHTGQTVRNYVATNGRPYSGGVIDGSKPVEPTNQLPVGAEQLRGGAAQAATATLAAVDFSDPYDVFFITNRSPAVAGLEVGALPEEPFTPRSPQGMFGVTLQEITMLANTGLF